MTRRPRRLLRAATSLSLLALMAAPAGGQHPAAAAAKKIGDPCDAKKVR